MYMYICIYIYIYIYIYTLIPKCNSIKNTLDAKTKDNTRLCGHYNGATTYMLKKQIPYLPAAY